MQFIWRLGIAENDDQGPIEELRAVDFDLVGKGVSRELCNVSLQVQNVQA